MQGNAVNALGSLKADIGPCLAAIERFEHAAADRGRIADITLARADPDNVRIGLVDRHRANRGHRLIVKHRCPV